MKQQRDARKETAINQFIEAFDNLAELSIDALPAVERRRVEGSLINATLESEGSSVRCRIWAQNGELKRTLLTIVLKRFPRRNGLSEMLTSGVVE